MLTKQALTAEETNSVTQRRYSWFSSILERIAGFLASWNARQNDVVHAIRFPLFFPSLFFNSLATSSSSLLNGMNTISGELGLPLCNFLLVRQAYLCSLIGRRLKVETLQATGAELKHVKIGECRPVWRSRFGVVCGANQPG